MKHNGLYGCLVLVCIFLGGIAVEPVCFIAPAQASPYTIAEVQDQETEPLPEPGAVFEPNAPQSLEDEIFFSQPQDETVIEDRGWEQEEGMEEEGMEEEGMEEEPLEEIEGLEELPEESAGFSMPSE